MTFQEHKAHTLLNLDTADVEASPKSNYSPNSQRAMQSVQAS